MWVDQAYYKDIFCGDVLTTKFNKYIKKAQQYIDYITLAKANNAIHSNNDFVIDKIKESVCIVAELYQELDQEVLSNKQAIALSIENQLSSETVKSHSVSYKKQSDFKNETEIQKEYEEKIYDEVYKTLWATGLLYRGVANV